MTSLPWIVALVALALLAAVLAAAAVRASRLKRLAPLPTEWTLTARPVFSIDERRVYRLLREALPHHVVLLKLPLVRFCQPNDPGQVRFWYDLLGGNHVTFAICSANGRVLAAIDLDTGGNRRTVRIKQSVLGACRVRYLRCSIDNLPTVAELQLLILSGIALARGSQAAPSPPRDLDVARDALSSAVASRRAERSAMSHDSTVFQDSFFVPDNRLEGFSPSEFSGAQTTHSAQVGPGSHHVNAAAPPLASETVSDGVSDMVVDASKSSSR